MPLFGGTFAFGQPQPLVELAWFQPTAQAFMVLAALATAALCLGRYRVIGRVGILERHDLSG